MGPTAGVAIPDLPPLPQAPIQLRVTRRDAPARTRRRSTTGCAELRAERDQLAAHDPVRLREELAAAETARVERGGGGRRRGRGVRRRDGDARGGGRRPSARRPSARPRSTRAGATPRPRSTSSGCATRTRTGSAATSSDGSTEAERLLREGFQADPDELVATLTEDDSVETIEKTPGARPASPRAARPGEPARDRRARVAPGAARLHAARARRRAQGSSRPARGDRPDRPPDHRDVHHGVPRRGRCSSSG